MVINFYLNTGPIFRLFLHSKTEQVKVRYFKCPVFGSSLFYFVLFVYLTAWAGWRWINLKRVLLRVRARLSTRRWATSPSPPSRSLSPQSRSEPGSNKKSRPGPNPKFRIDHGSGLRSRPSSWSGRGREPWHRGTPEKDKICLKHFPGLGKLVSIVHFYEQLYH